MDAENQAAAALVVLRHGRRSRTVSVSLCRKGMAGLFDVSESDAFWPPQPYADEIKHPPEELEGLGDLHGTTLMPTFCARGDQRLSEILGFTLRKEPWEIKPEDAKLLLVSRLVGGPALQVPSQKHAKWVNKSEPHVFFVENDTQDACDIEECDRQLISTSGADSHTVTPFDDFIAVTRASSSSGKDSPYPKKVGQFHLALLERHPNYGSDVFDVLDQLNLRE